MLERFTSSLTDTARLQRGYRWLTTGLGCLIVAMGSAVVIFLMYKTRLTLGLPMEEGSLEGRHIPFLTWIGITIVSVPIIFHACRVLVVGTFGLIMVFRGKFTLAEAKAYALCGKYPRYWFQHGA